MFGFAGLLMVLAGLLGFISFVASIWITVLAFKRHVAWGLAVLFVPFAIVAYAIKYWNESRKPFLIGLASGAASMALIFVGVGMGAAAIAGEMAAMQAAEMQEPIDTSSREHEPAPALPIATTTPSVDDVLSSHPGVGTTPSIAEARPIDPSPTKTTGAAARYAVFDMSELTNDGYAPVAMTSAKELVGREAKVVATDGRVHRGALRKADGRSVEIERAFNGGTLVVEFRKPEIKTLLVSIEP